MSSVPSVNRRPIETIETSVLVVGAGASGMAAGLMLGRLGVDTIVVERHSSTANLPKAHILNQRTMEIFGELDLADEIYAVGAPMDKMDKTAWWTSFGGPSVLHGREVGHIDAWGGGADRIRYEEASPYRLTNLPQNQLEPILRAALEQRGQARLLFGHELLSLSQSSEGIVGVIHDLEQDRLIEVRASYLIGADGGRTVGDLLGVQMQGKRDLLHMTTVHFRCDLGAQLPDAGVAIYRFVNPDGPGAVHRGTLVQMGGGGWGRQCQEWVHSYSSATPAEESSPREVVESLRSLLGLPDITPEVLRVSDWKVEGVVADRYRVGRAFLVGDAAHRHPPAGGLGLNSGLQDVHNLCWKLRMVVRRCSSDLLLDSYETERRPVAEHNVAHALKGFFDIQGVDQALGWAPDMTSQAGWNAIARYFGDQPEAARHRLAVAEAIEVKRDAYRALNMEIGYSYADGAMVWGENDAPNDSGSSVEPIRYEPVIRPGARFPHAWFEHGGALASTVSIPRGMDLVLVTFTARGSEIWAGALDRARELFSLSIQHVELLGAMLSVGTESVEMADHFGISADEAVIVRPDGHVLWRGGADPEGATRRLIEVLSEGVSLLPVS